MRASLLTSATQLAGSNGTALESGISPAYAKDWVTGQEYTGGPAVILTSPLFWGIVAAALIAGAVIVAAVYIKADTKRDTDIRILKDAGQVLTPEQYAQAIRQYFSVQAEAGKFPWGWVLGIFGTAVGGTLVYKILARELDKRRGGRSSRQLSAEYE
jgi:hypothetical protein